MNGETQAGVFMNREAVTGGWNKVNNEELHDLYSPSIIQKIRWVGHVACKGIKETHIRFW
jgi:hypothetical protein